MEEFQPIDEYTITDLETLRVVADPLRAQILELLAHQPQNVKQVAEKLGIGAGKLYYHFNMLEKHGLVQVVETRVSANIIEKIYRATARKLDIDPDLLNFSTEQGKENIFAMFTSLLDTTREELLRSLQARALELEKGASARPRRVIANREVMRISDEYAEEFTDRLEALLKEFSAAAEEAPEGRLQAYSLTVVFSPSFFFDEEQDQPKGVDHE